MSEILTAARKDAYVLRLEASDVGVAAAGGVVVDPESVRASTAASTAACGSGGGGGDGVGGGGDGVGGGGDGAGVHSNKYWQVNQAGKSVSVFINFPEECEPSISSQSSQLARAVC